MGCTANIDYNANSHWPISILLTRKCVVWAPPHLSPISTWEWLKKTEFCCTSHRWGSKKCRFGAALDRRTHQHYVPQCPIHNLDHLYKAPHLPPDFIHLVHSCWFLHWLPSLFRRCVLLSWTTMSQLDPYLDITKTSVKFAVKLVGIDYMSSM